MRKRFKPHLQQIIELLGPFPDIVLEKCSGYFDEKGEDV